MGARIPQAVGLILFVCILFYAGSSWAGDKWTRTDTAFEVAYAAAATVDAFQTVDIGNHDDMHEVNPVLAKLAGRNSPDPVAVTGFFLFTTAAHAAISYHLPKPWRRVWQGTTLIFESGIISHNTKLGLRVRF